MSSTRIIIALVGLFTVAGCSHPAGGSTPAANDSAVAPTPTPTPADDEGLPTKGASCLADTDCDEGGICEGEGCGDETPGTCVYPAARSCTRDSRVYCGCDGETFRSSGSCPGRRYASKGECPGGDGDDGTTPAPATGRADGEACTSAEQCEGGVCEGEGCGDDQPGVCTSNKRACTRDYRAYCGCDGTTFHGSGSCPGQRFSHRGEC